MTGDRLLNLFGKQWWQLEHSRICALDSTALLWNKWPSCWHDQNILGTIIFQV